MFRTAPASPSIPGQSQGGVIPEVLYPIDIKTVIFSRYLSFGLLLLWMRREGIKIRVADPDPSGSGCFGRIRVLK